MANWKNETYDHKTEISKNMQDAKQNTLAPISTLFAKKSEGMITPFEAMVK